MSSKRNYIKTMRIIFCVDLAAAFLFTVLFFDWDGIFVLEGVFAGIAFAMAFYLDKDLRERREAKQKARREGLNK